MKPRRLHVAGALILLSWFASLGWLVKRQYYSNGYPAGVSTANRLAPGSRFYAVYAGGVQVGTASLSADTLPGGGARIVTRFDIGARDSLQSRLQTVTLTPELTLTGWSASTSGENPTRVRGIRNDGGDFTATLADDSGTARSMALEPGRALPLLAAALRASLNAILTPADSVVLPVLDPLSAGLAQLRMRVLPSRSPAVVVDSAALDPATGKWVAALSDTVPVVLLWQVGMDAPVRLWLDGSGFPVFAELPDGLVLKRTAFEIANLNFRHGDRPAGPRAQLRRHRASAGDPVLPGDTAATLVFPARDSAIAVLVEAAVANAASREDSVAELAQWLARHIKPGAGQSDALATLRAGRGSPAGRARLAIAALRHAGVPARLAIGMRQGGADVSAQLLPQAYVGGWRHIELDRGTVTQDSSVRVLRLRTSGFPFEYDALLASSTRRPE